MEVNDLNGNAKAKLLLAKFERPIETPIRFTHGRVIRLEVIDCVIVGSCHTYRIFPQSGPWDVSDRTPLGGFDQPNRAEGRPKAGGRITKETPTQRKRCQCGRPIVRSTAFRRLEIGTESAKA